MSSSSGSYITAASGPSSSGPYSTSSSPSTGGSRGGSSAWQSVMNQVGLGHNQMHNAMQSNQWNAIRNTYDGGPYSVANNPANAKYYKGGKRRGGSMLGTAAVPGLLWLGQNRLTRGKRGRGGAVGSVLATAAAPAALWGLKID